MMIKQQKKGLSLTRIFTVIVLIIVLIILAVQGLPYITSLAGGAASTTTLDNLARAKELYSQEGQAHLNEIRQLLQPIADRSEDPTVAPQALMLLAQINNIEGKQLERKELLKRAYSQFPASKDYPQVAVAYARALEEAGEVEQASRILKEIRDTAPPDLRAPALSALGRLAEQAGNLVEARDLLRKAVNDAQWDSQGWNQAMDALGRVNVALIFSTTATPESEVYRVQKGDSITRIGNTLNTTQGLITRANNIDEATILNIGQPLKVTPKEFKIVIERSTRRLFLIDKDGIFKRYSVGLGKPGHETVLGSYKIGNKEKNPVWHKPGYGPIAANAPDNELGTRWMPLVPDQKDLPTDLGIHGTIRPDTIGSFCSNGCARMYPADVEELYDLVVRATPVDIVEKYTPNVANNSSDIDK